MALLTCRCDCRAVLIPEAGGSENSKRHGNKADPQLDGEANHAAEQLPALTGRDWNTPKRGGERLGTALDGNRVRHLFCPSAVFDPRVSAFKNSGLIRPGGAQRRCGRRPMDRCAVVVCFSSSRPHCQQGSNARSGPL